MHRLPPATRAQPSRYVEYQTGDAPILDGRYGEMGRQTLAAPVEIYHPVFAGFVANVKDESLDVPEDVVRATASFMTSMSKISTSDAPRTESVPPGWMKTTSSPIAVILPRFGPAALAIVEVKNELGFSGEPSVQGSFTYLDFWKGESQAPFPPGQRRAGCRLRCARGCLEVLHGARLVHGDVRLPNIVVAVDANANADDVGQPVRAMLVDFDWAGAEGVAQYPLHLSPNAGWVEGVGDYGLIRAAHDRAMVDKL
uniref:Phosphate:H symporter (Phosphate:H symporter, variant) n=1 Tax=Ganoderma boninense TaxID=34458 RepID=A0A5K1K509_9APHY|nr:Phosphate:H symporter (Phosphate:H symporter, variant) [Ganoderma boninense]